MRFPPSPSIIADTVRLEQVITSIYAASPEELHRRQSDLERERLALTMALPKTTAARVLVRDERDSVCHELRIVRQRLRDMEVC